MLLHVTSRSKCVISYPFKLGNTWKNNLLEPSPQRPFCESPWAPALDKGPLARPPDHHILCSNPFWRCVNHDPLDGNSCLFYLYLKTGLHLQLHRWMWWEEVSRFKAVKPSWRVCRNLHFWLRCLTPLKSTARLVTTYHTMHFQWFENPSLSQENIHVDVYIYIYVIYIIYVILKWLDSKIKSQKRPQSNPQRTKSCNLRH